MSATFLEVARLIRFGSRRRPWRVSDLSVAGVIVCDGLNVREHMFVAVARDESEAPVRAKRVQALNRTDVRLVSISGADIDVVWWGRRARPAGRQPAWRPINGVRGQPAELTRVGDQYWLADPDSVDEREVSA
jgi:hypothetical protein